MKKVLAILLAGMMTATAFAGCGGGSSSSTDSKTESTASSKDGGGSTEADMDPSWADESLFGDETDITLKVWAPDKAVSLTKEQVEAFKKHYSNIKFKSIEVVAQGESDAATQIMNDPEKAADVFGFPSDQLDKLIATKVLSPVAQGFVNTIKANNAQKTIDAVTEGDKLYAFPETNDNGYYLVYDNTVVTDEDAKTLEGVLAACKAKNKQFILDSGNGFYSCMFAFTGGAIIDGFEADGVTQKFVEYNEDEVIDTLMAFAKLMKDYKNTYSSQDTANISSSFKNGKAGAGVDGTWNSQADKDALGDKFGAAKLPTINVGGTDKQIISMFGYKYIGVNSYSKFPRSAQILAYYLTGQEAQEQRAEELGWGPSNLEAVKKYADDPILLALQEQSKNSVPSIEIKQTIWAGMGTLGSSLYKDSWKPEDRNATKTLFDKIISNVKDE